MLQLTIIGNLGADAHVEHNNGNPFVSFNVAHTERWTSQDGQQHESTQWVSCALNGDGGKLLPYLKKGATIYAVGRVRTRVFSSEKERRMVAGLNLSINHIELVGGRRDDIPARLFDPETGAMVDIFKAYYLNRQQHPTLATLADTGSRRFTVDKYGYVTEVAPSPAPMGEQVPASAEPVAGETAPQQLDTPADVPEYFGEPNETAQAMATGATPSPYKNKSKRK